MTPSSLLTELSSGFTKPEDDSKKRKDDNIIIHVNKNKLNKKLIQEIPQEKETKKVLTKKSDAFRNNLQKAFRQNSTTQEESSAGATKTGEIKIRNDQVFLKEIKSRKLC